MSNPCHFHNGSVCHGDRTIKEAINRHISYMEDIDIMKIPTTKIDAPNHPCFVGIRHYAEEHYKKIGYKTVAKITIKQIVEMCCK